MGVVKISVIKNGVETFLKIPTGFRMNAEEFNSAFLLDVAIKNGSTIGVRVPIEDNAVAMDFVHELAVRDRILTWECRIYVDEVPKYNGTLELNEVVDVWPDAYLDCDFVNDSYPELISGMTIRDVLDETVNLGATAADMAAEAALINASSWPTKDFCFPTIYNIDQYDGNVADWIGWLNRWNQSTQEFSLNYADYPGTHALAPQVYIFTVLKRCFTHFGYRVSGNVFDDVKLKKRFIIGLRTLDDMGQLGSLKVKIDADVMVTDTSALIEWDSEVYNYTGTPVTYPNDLPYDPIANGTHFVRCELYIGAATGTVNIYDHLDNLLHTFTPVAYATNSIEFEVTTWDGVAATGLKFESSTGDSCEIYANSMAEYIAPGYTSNQYFNKWNGTFNLKYCVPNTGIADFLKAVKLYAGVDFRINSITKDVEIYFIKDQLDSKTYKTPEIKNTERNFRMKPGAAKKYRMKWPGQNTSVAGKNYVMQIESYLRLPEPILNEVYYVSSLNAYFEAVAGEWVNLGPRIDFWDVGTGEVVEVTQVAKLCEMDYKTYDSQSILCPVLNAVGISKETRDFENTWDLVFCSYLGLQDGTVDVYPMASAFGMLLNGDVVDEYGDWFDGSFTSLGYTFWYRWLTFLSRNWPMEVLVLSDDAASLVGDPRTKWNLDANDYLIQSAEMELGRRDNLVKFTVFKL